MLPAFCQYFLKYVLDYDHTLRPQLLFAPSHIIAEEPRHEQMFPVSVKWLKVLSFMYKACA